MKNPSYTRIASLLHKRLAVIADHEWRDRDPAAHLDALRDVSLALQEAAGHLSGELSPRLAHFLERCSYDKALAYIEAEEPQSG